MTQIIPFDQGEVGLDWIGLTEAIAAGHTLPKAQVTDTFMYRGADTVLNRTAWIDGMGIAVKTATIFPGNSEVNLPNIGGVVSLYEDQTGVLLAVLDFHLVTKWKTAADSLLAARKLARADSRSALIIGAGTVARSMVEAYRAGFPEIEISVWNRNADRAKALSVEMNVEAVSNLPAAVAQADIICCATMSTEPVLRGAWLRAGQHVDLIGAYRPDMREVDDDALTKARIFVDNFETTLEHIGELKDPIGRGILCKDDVIADFYKLDSFRRRSGDEITICKNGGGAHLDLMTCRYILENWNSR